MTANVRRDHQKVVATILHCRQEAAGKDFGTTDMRPKGLDAVQNSHILVDPGGQGGRGTPSAGRGDFPQGLCVHRRFKVPLATAVSGDVLATKLRAPVEFNQILVRHREVAFAPHEIVG